jgi:hypothetical protein
MLRQPLGFLPAVLREVVRESGRKRKAWGRKPQVSPKVAIRARKTGESRGNRLRCHPPCGFVNRPSFDLGLRPRLYAFTCFAGSLFLLEKASQFIWHFGGR